MLRLDISGIGRLKSLWDRDHEEKHVLLKPISG